jgi:uncharacterized protein with von Willebrand factor type A (vWA) domain
VFTRPEANAAASLHTLLSLLRESGLRVPAAAVGTFLDACAVLGPEAGRSVYWAGRGVLCSRAEDIPLFDDAFAAWLGQARPGEERAPGPHQAVVCPAGGSPGEDEEGQQDAGPAMVSSPASRHEVLRHRDVATLSEPEREELGRLLSGLTVVPPRRRGRRWESARRGPLDLRRTVREDLARLGEPGPVRHRRRTTCPRRVVLLVDVSGSMAAYAETFLRWSHRLVAQAPSTVDVFTVGTRLTRVSHALRLREPDEAVVQAGRSITDWSGGTRLGEALTAFLDGWGRRGLARGAVVVVFSDGLERGDPAELAAAMAQLHRLAHRVLWVNPHRGKVGYEPVQAGMAAALPHLDGLVAGHSLAAFEALTGELARA